MLLLLATLLHGPCATSLQPLAARWSAEHPGFECAREGTALALSDQVPPLVTGKTQVPIAVGGVALAYNLLVAGDLRLTQALLAALYQGKIARWSDPRIAAENPGMKLPDLPVTLVREDAAALDLLGQWLGPAGGAGGRAVPSKDGGLAAVARTEGALGAIDAAAARRAGLYIASLRNRDGAFLQPSMHSLTRAAAGLRLPADFRVSLVDAKGVASYPLAAFAYAVVSERPEDPAAIAAYLRWAVHDGQRWLVPLGWAPLPGLVVLLVDERLRAMSP